MKIKKFIEIQCEWFFDIIINNCFPFTSNIIGAKKENMKK
jgi:hypothetical protein